MGSKQRLLKWIHEVISEFEFNTALDAFSGSGCVSYLLKGMGKKVVSNDFLNFSATIAKALIENSEHALDRNKIESLLEYDPHHKHFIENTFRNIFYTSEDLRFLDRVCWNIRKLPNEYNQAIAMSALIRSCVKRQPRGVFTVAGDPERYKDGRRDLRLSLREHFIEQVEVYNKVVFDNGQENHAIKGDVFSVNPNGYDLVYLDPPYIPRHDDNCYIKRYHFLEGLSCYWKDLKIMQETRVKKIQKPYTPFSYRREAWNTFDRLFSHFSSSIIVLSYSSNGFPDLATLRQLLRRYKSEVTVHERNHRYHFGTHSSAHRNEVREYLIVGQ